MPSSSAFVGSPLTDFDESKKPLWKFVTKLEKIGIGGGNYRFQCKFCHVVKNGLYTQVKAHLLKWAGKGIEVCEKVKSKDIAEFQKLIEEADLKIKNAQPKSVPLPPPSTRTRSVELSLHYHNHNSLLDQKGKSHAAVAVIM